MPLHSPNPQHWTMSQCCSSRLKRYWLREACSNTVSNLMRSRECSQIFLHQDDQIPQYLLGITHWVFKFWESPAFRGSTTADIPYCFPDSFRAQHFHTEFQERKGIYLATSILVCLSRANSDDERPLLIPGRSYPLSSLSSRLSVETLQARTFHTNSDEATFCSLHVQNCCR